MYYTCVVFKIFPKYVIVFTINAFVLEKQLVHEFLILKRYVRDILRLCLYMNILKISFQSNYALSCCIN